MAKLYPPSINGTLPAFNGTVLTVPFSMNRTVSWSGFSSLRIKIKTVQSGVLVYNTATQNYNQELCEAYFNIPDDILKIGSYYKVQMAYVDGTDIGYYSTVGIVKYTTTPTLNINDFSYGTINANTLEYIGTYSQKDGDVGEKVYSYRFDVLDRYGNVFATSGDCLHDSSADTEVYESQDSWTLETDLVENEVYTIRYTVTTSNNMTVSSNKYKIIQTSSIDPEIKATVKAEMVFDDGYILVSLVGEKDPITKVEYAATGAFRVLRACSKDGYGTWVPLTNFVLNGEQPSRLLWQDFTVENGYYYMYALQQYNDYGVYSNKLLSNEILAEFEDAFLFDGERQLKIRFNPKVTSFKKNRLEQKVETIGSKYPYIFRNGRVEYREFPISGLISYFTDDAELFISKEELGVDAHSIQYTTDNIKAEKVFKMKVLDFLTDGQPKVFRSPTEGNYIVRLMNSSLSPEDKTGRMLHTFSCTAYEIAEFNYQQLANYGFITISEPENLYTRWQTVEFRCINDEGNIEYQGTDTQILTYTPALTVKFTDMMPGTKVNIWTYYDANPITIVIGSTGSYYLNASENPIYRITLAQGSVEQQGQLVYSYASKTINKFSTIQNFTVEEYPCYQIFGSSSGTTDIYGTIEDIRTKITNMYKIHFEKKEEVEIFSKQNHGDYYSDPGCNYVFTDFTPYCLYKVSIVPTGDTHYYFVTEDGSIVSLNEKDASRIQAQDLYKIYLNGAEVDLSETHEYNLIRDIGITDIKINPGIWADLTVQVLISTYEVENTDSDVSAYKADYVAKQKTLKEYIYSDTNMNEYNTTSEKELRYRAKRAYTLYIDALEKALKELEVQ